MNPILPIEYMVVILAAVAAAAVALAWRAWAEGRAWLRWSMTGLRLIGVAGLAALALNPGRWEDLREDEQTEWAVMADRSQSMAAADVDGRTRWETAQGLAARAASLARDPSRVRIYTFAERLEPVGGSDLSALRPDGGKTDVAGAGKALLARSRTGSRRLVGIVLISDGRQTEPTPWDDFAVRARAQECPVFVLPLGGEIARKDLSVSVAQRQYATFVGQKTKITCVAANRGLGDLRTVVTLRDAAGKTLASEKVDLADGRSVPVSFEVTPDRAGYFAYRMGVPPWEGEGNGANNEASVGMTVLQNRMRIFVVEGTPYWDSKFLVQLLRKQPNMEVTSVYRLASERFFKVETDASKVSESSQAIFPDDARALAAYDVLVFGKGAEYFLTPNRIRNLREFVRDRGGCVLFSRGKPYTGTFDELEFLEPMEWGEPYGAPLRARPTKQGEDAGLFGDLLPGSRDGVWQKLPPIENARRAGRLKAFCRVLLEGTIEGPAGAPAVPLLVTRRFGKGMVAVFNADGLWQWDFFPSVNEAARMYPELWTQIIQWAATYAEFLPGQDLAIQLSDSSVYPNQPVRARVAFREPARAGQTPVLRLAADGKTVQDLAVVPGAAEATWDAVFSVRDPGSYVVEGALASSTNRICAVLEVKAPPTEKDNWSADPEALARLAETSGGRVIASDALPEAARQLEPALRTVDLNKAIWVPRWNRWWILCGLVSVFGIEWFVRRRNGLM